MRAHPSLRRPQVKLDQRQRFLELFYGKSDDRQGVYLVHTNLSVFAKTARLCGSARSAGAW